MISFGCRRPVRSQSKKFHTKLIKLLEDLTASILNLPIALILPIYLALIFTVRYFQNHTYLASSSSVT